MVEATLQSSGSPFFQEVLHYKHFLRTSKICTVFLYSLLLITDGFMLDHWCFQTWRLPLASGSVFLNLLSHTKQTRLMGCFLHALDWAILFLKYFHWRNKKSELENSLCASLTLSKLILEKPDQPLDLGTKRNSAPVQDYHFSPQNVSLLKRGGF